MRVSLEWYYISSYNNRTVTLIDFVSGEEKQNVYWETLVLVKGPIITGPVVIRENLLKQGKKWGWGKPAPKEVVTPYTITNAIQNIIEEVHPGNAPTRVSTRKRTLLYDNLDETTLAKRRVV